MHKIITQESAQERKRRNDRERIAAKRAAMDPDRRAELRRKHDADYRARQKASK